MVMRGSPVPTFQTIIRLSLPGGKAKDATPEHSGRRLSRLLKKKRCARVRPTRSEEYVARGWVPGDNADPFGVSLQNHDGIREGAGQEVIRDLPHLDRKDEEQ